MEWPISWNDVKNNTPFVMDLTGLVGMSIIFSQQSLPMEDGMLNELSDAVANGRAITVWWRGDPSNGVYTEWGVQLHMNARGWIVNGTLADAVYTGIYRGKMYKIHFDFMNKTLCGQSVALDETMTW